jgi:hypothetical protein
LEISIFSSIISSINYFNKRLVESDVFYIQVNFHRSFEQSSAIRNNVFVNYYRYICFLSWDIKSHGTILCVCWFVLHNILNNRIIRLTQVLYIGF